MGGRPEPANRFFEAIRRHRVFVLGGLVFGALAGLLLGYLTPPIYRAQGQLEFQQASPAAAKNRFGDPEVQFVKSHSLAQRVAESEGLSRNKRIANALGIRPLGTADTNSELVDRLRSQVQVKLGDDFEWRRSVSIVEIRWSLQRSQTAIWTISLRAASSDNMTARMS